MYLVCLFYNNYILYIYIYVLLLHLSDIWYSYSIKFIFHFLWCYSRNSKYFFCLSFWYQFETQKMSFQGLLSMEISVNKNMVSLLLHSCECKSLDLVPCYLYWNSVEMKKKKKNKEFIFKITWIFFKKMCYITFKILYM